MARTKAETNGHVPSLEASTLRNLSEVKSKSVHSVFVNARDILHIPLLAVDAGGRKTKRFIPGVDPTPVGKPSFILSPERRQEGKASNETSVLSFNGNRIFFGLGAQQLGGTPVYQLVDKSEILELAVLASLPPGYNHYEIEELRLLVTDTTRSEVVEKASQCLGQKEFLINGKPATLEVKKLYLINECEGAFYWLRANNLIANPDEITAIISLGGRHFCGRTFTSDGTIDRVRELSGESGTFQVASKIATALLGDTGDSVNESDIMDAIEYSFTNPGLKGQCIVKLEQGEIDFTHLLQPYVEKQMEEFRGKMRRRWGDIIGNITEGFFIGGSAPLAELTSLFDQAKGFFKIPENPRYLDLRGSVLMFEQDMLEITANGSSKG